jgi:hypothetical protein
LSVPNRAARYAFQRKNGTEADWQTMKQYTMPDGALSGAAMELAATVLLHKEDCVAVLQEDGTLALYADRVSFRFLPVAGWERMTSAHVLAARYGVETTHTGRGTWSTKGALQDEASTDEVRLLVRDTLRIGSDVSVHTSGVLIVETRASGLALRLTPLGVFADWISSD